MAGTLTDEELETLSDDKLAELIIERTGMDGEAADRALVIIRGEIPEGTIF